MGFPLVSPPASDGLAAAVKTALGPAVTISNVRRLTGGASRETWAFAANGEELILRRDPPGRRLGPVAMRREADAMRACRSAGLRVPEVLAHDDGTLLGTAGLVMRSVPGETIARRILRDETFAAARKVLVQQLAEFMAGLHALQPQQIPDLEQPEPLGKVWQLYERIDDTSPVFEKAYQWLMDHPPPASPAAVVHGDLRLGNLIVDPDGLAAVIDWELVHLGDPLEDLAWLSLKAWRFGAPLEVAGLGTVDELVSAYESAGGRTVDPAAFHWWLVQRTLTWGIGCMAQADVHLRGQVRSVELAAVGRRAAEQEWDLLELLAPDAARAAASAPIPQAAPDAPTRYGRPTARELLAAVREFLTDDVLPQPGKLGFHGRVAANVLALVDRELAAPQAQPVRQAGDDWETLALSVRDRLLVASPGHLEAARRSP
jgi:aminoglycoside phosphotransferase (APT) family kinase protein